MAKNKTRNNYKYGGHEHDSETGLDFYGARYYGNTLGRFITPDWAAAPVPVPYANLRDPQSLNLYSYVRNVPTWRTDADGHETLFSNDKAFEDFGQRLDKVVRFVDRALKQASERSASERRCRIHVIPGAEVGPVAASGGR